MTVHRHNSGIVDSVNSYGHGRGKALEDGERSHSEPLLTSDNNDGTLTEWEFTGNPDDALKEIARIEMMARTNGNQIAVKDSESRVTLIYTPDDFWIEDDTGEFRPNLVKHSDALAW